MQPVLNLLNLLTVISMIIIDKPYVSDFLINTIKKNNFAIIDTEIARSMINDQSLNWISEKEAVNLAEQYPNEGIYSNSENSINWIEKNVKSEALIGNIRVFKNKVRFRELISRSFPDFFYRLVDFHNLRNLDTQTVPYPFIIKPATGFFSIGVRKVNKPSDWIDTLKRIEWEMEETKDLYPKEVINTHEFIIEEYLEGEEYAIDCYFDDKGEPVILNILHHLFSSRNDVSDRVYSTSREIIESNYKPIKEFLTMVGASTNLINFPVHVEIRIDSNGKISPVEVNPLRFGGWCSTGDLAWYAYGINPYECFLNSKRPDWNSILESKGGRKYSIVILDNNSGIKESDIEGFDTKKLLSDFNNPMELRMIDYMKYSVFGFLFVETKESDNRELNTILHSDLRKYIIPKKI